MQNLRSSAAALLLALPFAGWAQPRASACFFNEDFEGENALAGWDLGTQVERRTPEGVPFERRWSLGMLECEHEMPLAPDLRRLTTPQNVGRAEFVQVEACFDYTLPFTLPQWAVPTRIESRFVAARRHWRGG